MIRFLIHRPVAVSMAFLAFFILGIITYMNIPVSLLPDIPIPEITVQVAGGNLSARELENTVVSPIRQQLLQVAKLRDMHSETRDGSAVVRLSFEYGVNTDLAFIEVNEKIDAAMNNLPRAIERPRAVKASATDIPVFFLHLTLKDDEPFKKGQESDFLNVSELAQSIIKRRIEQLPQVAMVDMTGVVDKQIQVIPNNNTLEITGITLSDISAVLQNNNIEPGTMIVKDGHYQYNISFSSVIRTLEDVQDIYFKKNGRIFQLRDLADISLVSRPEEGISLYNGKRAITLGIIKQADENMSSLADAMANTLHNLQGQYPEIEFSQSQNQTELLEYTISNLQQNLILAFIFVCLVSALFMRDVRSPLIIGVSMFVSLIVSLLFFFVCNVSLNIVSLTGLILALGMMIDNSIIVTDNIGQHRRKGMDIDESCIRGTNEVIVPMLSSSFTTISVFVPLIFMSGIAGAVFFDQAFSVTVGLLVSYLTGIMLLPVLYKLVYSIKFPQARTKRLSSESLPERVYHHVADWVFGNKMLTIAGVLLIFPLCVFLFFGIRKEKMPEISQQELIVNVEWNENIHLWENQQRSTDLLRHVQAHVEENAALIGRQQFVLNRKGEQTFSESEFYLKTEQTEDIPKLKKIIDAYMRQQYPLSIVSYAPAGTLFERIFVTADPDLRLEYYTGKGKDILSMDSVQAFQAQLYKITGYHPKSISFRKQLDLRIDKEKLLLYDVSYDHVYQALKAGFKQEEITTLRSYQQYLPVIIGQRNNEVSEVINHTSIQESPPGGDGRARKLPLNTFISTYPAQGMKTIVGGRNGEYIPFDFHEVQDPDRTLALLKDNITPNNERDIQLSGSFFSNRKMLDELLVILVVSILLMYFILAAQFESFIQPLIVLLEIPIAIAAALGLLILFGHSLNLMSAIGIIVTCGIIINDSILKLDIMNQLRRQGIELIAAIHEAGRRRLNAILMTSLTSIVCMLPLFFSHDMGSELEKPLAIATIGGMLIGTPISLFVVPLVYWFIYRKKENKV
ncbi:efflux RND transporter permease subunit [Parapedobacter koreensis]|uniref:Multidrug efflux pump subunit AcrB n=1 Tax=Parapedobacter koreensis TaxID=332977 RepID=A0A1H7F6U7_9SPHI|nr:efflux RND transporter permease subunit [Parapedobacter koreensis]SEK20052.1 Multidrug efflux pump subunit AcrB [Parapedobacter koreensis]